MQNPVSSSFAEWAAEARYLEFPQEARRRAIDAITDCIGCQLIGSAEPMAEMLLATFPWSEEKTAMMPAALVGRRRFAGPADAGLFNGTSAHALDYDDTNHPAYAHPSAVLVPAMLAVSHLSDATGHELVNAYIVGLDLIGKLGRAFNTSHYERGWHATKTFGCLAAALAASAIMRLDADKIEIALAIAASSASGLRSNFGTMVKPLHAGQAAQAGVTAALLAREGFTASKDFLEHRFGFAHLFSGEKVGDVAALAAPGQPLEILTDYGLALKPYPSCGATHPAIEAAIVVHGLLDKRAVKRVRVGVSQLSFGPLIYPHPRTPLEGKFSMEFCVAVALAFGEVTIGSFVPSMIDDPVIDALIARTVVETDDRVVDSSEFAAVVSVVSEDDETFEETVCLAKGKPSRWLSEKEISTKFMDCAGHIVAADKASRIFSRLRKLDSSDHLSDLLEKLHAESNHHSEPLDGSGPGLRVYVA
jgi:2-methylcitrate dehydratase PrpD